ncbi:MAG: tRNA (adenosine(37)-N6)-threonylcarbamoyltransferase complex ATPase subunit type 1 TsaE [Lachnospiraceae bacterium]|nr:tRNA (adenosine(37)-N6)-threonylcarbamoyltransferase complex ATPase subunit type 1 TsaE [Lachnospiraceae bacterium]
MVTEFESASAIDTYDLGCELGKKALPGEVYTLNGDLGAGKTVFAQGFAKGLGITDNVNSPTFTILQIYDKGRLTLYHFDVYRIADSSEMDEIGFDEYVYSDGVCLIEWAEYIEDILPEGYIRVDIKKDPEKGFDIRHITIDRPESKVND